MLKSNQKAFEGANKYATEAYKMVIEQLRLPYGSPEELKLDEHIRALIKPGFYEHFKSSPGDRKYYEVLEVQGHVNYQTVSHAYQVSYTAHYGAKKGRKALRELLGEDGFLTPVQKDGYIGPRFVYRGTKLAQLPDEPRT